MIEFISGMHPVIQALLATLFTWGMTALGAAVVFFERGYNRKLLDWMMGFAAGVMIAASYWSLLAPAIEMAQDNPLPAWVPAVVGFVMGGVFLRGIDRVLPHLHLGEENRHKSEGVKTSWERITLLVLAITLHNIPEGLAIGVAFGAAAKGLTSSSVAAAVALAIGIGIQNFPEAVAVSMPLRNLKVSRGKSFWYGQLSGFVEPIAGVLGASLVLIAQNILPYALAFAAGAMIFVVVEDLIPEAHREGNVDLATFGVMIGFSVMMVLDVALG